MIVHTCAQRSPEWYSLRLGIPTASAFDKILTPTGKVSSSAQKYLHALLAERMMGRAVEAYVSPAMQRGSELESEAVRHYELHHSGVATREVGFVTNSERTIGASPDRLIGDDGLLEIKCPSEAVHVSYLLSGEMDAEYRPQVQGQLWLTGRAWVDFLSYHPEMPPAIVRVERDEAYIRSLAAAVTTFSGSLEEAAEDLRRKGWIK